MIHVRPPEDEGDEALAALVRAGSAATFALLVTRYRRAVWVIARNLCARPRQAELVLQQTFLSVWRDASAFPPGATFAICLYRVAVRNALARRARDDRKPCSLEPSLPAFDPEGRPVASEGRWSELEEMKLGGLLHEALECMDDTTCAAFVLRDLLDLTREEAAAVLDISPAEIGRDAHRGRSMLRGFLDRV
jgi:RNA polymerase sigma-70 factor (ECF subfamily)